MGNKADKKTLLGSTQRRLFDICNFAPNSRVGVWAETKVKYIGENLTEDNASFDYTFDYVLCRLGRVSLKEASNLTGLSEKELKSKLLAAGHTLALVNDVLTVENFPVGAPFIIEVMTSSTSGGNKKIRIRIPQAFEDFILGKDHLAPGIN